MALIDDIRIKQDWTKDGYVFEQLKGEPSIPHTPCAYPSQGFASVHTLPELAKLAQDEMLSGVIESIVTVNPIFQLLPFGSIIGSALAYTHSNGVGVTSALACLGGTTAPTANPSESINIARMAKDIGRDLLNRFFEDLRAVQSQPGQLTKSCSVNNIMSYIGEVVQRLNGTPDFIMMPAEMIRAFLVYFRSAGSLPSTASLPSGQEVPAYSHIDGGGNILPVPIIRCDSLTTLSATAKSGGALHSIAAGIFDDGSRTKGISGLRTRPQFVHVTKKGGGSWEIECHAGVALFNTGAFSMTTGIDLGATP